MKNTFLFVSLFAALLSCSPEPSTDTHEAEGGDQKSVSEPTRVESITQAIRENPKNASLYRDRAEAHMQEQMFALALDDINRALRADSTDASFYTLKGEIFYLRKEPELAVNNFQKALELDPENTDALLKMAEIQLLLRQYQKCFDYANDALRVNDQLYMAYFIKGYAHFELGDSSLFVSSVQTSLELNPDFYEGYAMLGSFYSTAGSNLALDYYRSALDVRPNDSQARYGIGIFLQNQGRLEEAIAVYEEMLRLDSTHVLAWYNQGYIWLELEDQPERAIPFFEEAISLQPEYIDAIYNLGLAYERMDKPEKAKAYYRRALEVDPQYDFAALGLERLHASN